jgi:hypothetical protein
MKRLRWLGFLAVAIGAAVAVGAAGSGCLSTAAKQAYYGATGASARYFEIRSLGGPTSLDRFEMVTVDSFDAAPMLGIISPEFPPEVRAAIIRRLTEMRVFKRVGTGQAGAATLLIRGKFMDFDTGGSALRTVGFGVDPFLTAQIEIVEASTGRVLGVAMVTGTVKSAVRTGPQEVSDGVGKAVKGLFERHHTKIEEDHGGPRPEKKGMKWPWSKKN